MHSTSKVQINTRCDDNGDISILSAESRKEKLITTRDGWQIVVLKLDTSCTKTRE